MREATQASKAAPKKRFWTERLIMAVLILCSSVAILTTVGIVASLIFESIRFFQIVPITDFLFGLHWSPQMAIREDQVGSSGAFGAIPLLVGTLLISAVALTVAGPVGLMSAVFLSEYASSSVRSKIKPTLEILAGIPTVVYGFFAAIVVAPWLRRGGEAIGLDVSSESALAAGLVMGIMTIPFVSSISDDAITAVPTSLKEATSRVIGETMIVVMAAGLTAKLTLNPLDAVTTVTVQIVTLLTGDQEFDSPKTLSAFALGLMLFTVTLALNVTALKIVKAYREQYD